MDGVVSLLDHQHTTLVESLWAEFRAYLGVHGVSRMPIAHFSYHVAEQYDLPRLETALHQFTHEQRSFQVQTSGLGIFTGAEPVLCVALVRSLALDAFHRRVWEAIGDTGSGVNTYYAPDRWFPHITLTHHDVDHNLLPRVVRLLSERSFAWEITVDNLAVLYSGEQSGMYFRCPFGA